LRWRENIELFFGYVDLNKGFSKNNGFFTTYFFSNQSTNQTNKQTKNKQALGNAEQLMSCCFLEVSFHGFLFYRAHLILRKAL